MANLTVETYSLGKVSTNCYFIINEDAKEAIIVDPADNGAYIKSKLDNQGITPKAILLTHGHFDHILAVDFLKEAYAIPVIAHKAEQEILENPSMNLSDGLGGVSLSVKADQLVEDGEILHYLETDIRVVHTPGHTAGGTCYYFPKEKMLISGDTLFRGSVGRTDFPTGNMQILVKSIQEKLFILPEETIVYPGHDVPTEIKRERLFNPYLKG